ncbi:MAG: toprim domain-containing protein, partial [Nitrososphaera sp.]
SDWIILVEGRADVINLLRAGFDNAIAIEGARIDETVTKLTDGKKVVAFLDGDRAGDLILKELQGVVKIDKVLRAPPGEEVEDCTPLEISEILKDAASVVGEMPPVQQSQQVDRRHPRRVEREPRDEMPPQQPVRQPSEVAAQDSPEILTAVRDVFPQINETLEAVVLDGSMNQLLKVPVSEVIKRLDSAEGAKLLVLDGIVTQRLVDAADKVGIQYIIGHRTAELKKPADVRVRTFGDIGINN